MSYKPPYKITPAIVSLISIINSGISTKESMIVLSLKNAKNFCQHHLLPAITNNLIKMMQLDKPNSPTQKYQLV
ncbi:hypothetical protein AZO1586I_1460 [Bathymodiolus thermophilus thioautotrophic gill symbiont]|jgi:hypothetical protein|uniref:Uncharacterized protein n=2 Tax=sulfur-oxidizing symbionts TaxID=32036 RepID=A0ACA8ZRD2_9GAMM|nr:hypothetical protein [thiotrophic endosymbiont of Bathymodiolus puteoserpentis (Logatchev)]CAB5503683.1 hypothetical protein AZO1586R_1632 [Bathymodiolus azoricus thioautotrophic gill symbiont]CAB5505471.1 hypothetical protein AZO1586I_1460 [Bathymodiolus thermophilus thioautotrophic gill symbiont]CAC9505009.1 hypothetical protein [uncultured Gammaproteobacteria bacterium]CAC9529440.1 hypothetical protein [uncultured Gammaproteobacteria bacterium]CAC9531229.1 hypothetical protein [unculture